MEALMTGIMSSLGTLGVKRFAGVQPRKTKLPYVNFNQIDTFQEDVDTSGTRINNVVIRFDIWGTNSVEVAKRNDTIKDFYLKNNITLDVSERLLNTQLSGEALELDPDQIENGKEVWHGILDLLFLVCR